MIEIVFYMEDDSQLQIPLKWKNSG